MSAKTAIVIGGRFGDCANILPIARDIALKEGSCAVVVSAEFASIVEGCSYVEPVVISSHFTDLLPAIEQAQRMFERVLVAKVSEKSIGITTQCESFNEEAWRQCGYLEQWGKLPLVFDRRDRKREAALIEKMGNLKARPVVLCNFTGKSAPFPHGEELGRMLFKTGALVIDIGIFKAERIYDLVGLMDAADLLVTGDTATLHLAAASGVPVVNLVGDKPTRWHGSRPRNNSVMEIRYSEKHRLKEILDVQLGASRWRPRTWHVWSDYAMSLDARRRHEHAKATWAATGWIELPVKQTARVVNDPMRSLPFIKDLIGEAVRCAGPRDTIVLTNADTCVASDAAPCVAEAVKEFGCCYCFRRDFVSLNGAMDRQFIRGGKQYPGCDLFAFTVDWWKKHEANYPDLLLGTETWDWCLRVLMTQAGGGKFNDLICHEVHANTWEHPDYRHTLPSQLHNKRLAAPWLAANGVVFS